MKFFQLLLCAFGLFVLYTCRLAGQDVPQRLRTGFEPLDERLSSMVTADSASISPAEAEQLQNAIYLDAREPEEYAVSHLPAARSLGYKHPDYSVLDGIDPATPLVVYCTIGYRSERMAEELKSRGFDHVYNLYGSIYAWILSGKPIVDQSGETRQIHTYNRKWGIFLPDTAATKVY